MIDIKIVNDLEILSLNSYSDNRGSFKELYNSVKYDNRCFKQDNVSVSKKGTLRGLHFQNPNPQGKLVSVLKGKVLDVFVDLRKEKPTFGNYFSFILSDENNIQLYIPEGFAHGFLALTDSVFFYKCTECYNPNAEKCLLWNDKQININWFQDDIKEENLIISEKDKKGLKFQEHLEINNFYE